MASAVQTLAEDAGSGTLGTLRQLMVQSADSAMVRQEHIHRERVYRLHFHSENTLSTVVVKSFALHRAQRESLAITRWLPMASLEGLAPKLLAASLDPCGSVLWHLYEDLGDQTLEKTYSRAGNIELVVRALARLHVASAEHPILAECRSVGANLGPGLMETSARDARRILDVLQPVQKPNGVDADLRDLQDFMHTLELRARDDADWCLRHGGPEVLLHGDFTPANVLVQPGPESAVVRLIDWDHCGVGSPTYDLCTFLDRLPPRRRSEGLAAYRDAVAEAGWDPFPNDVLDRLFRIARSTRLAHALVWVALDAYESREPWSFEELRRVRSWFDELSWNIVASV